MAGKKKDTSLLHHLIGSRSLVWNLAKNDIKKKFAGSYFGVVWAFVQPVITVLVPWFYFQEALNGGTGVLVEYSYLVKKVVFQIDMLPVVKMISALFTHLFFVAFTIVLFICMGYMPDWYALQVIYYSFCMILFATGLVYATSAVTVFFRDMKEVVGILLQIGMWVTPIMWNFETMVQIPGWAITVLKLNPMYYIVSGYRNALINHIGFWEDMGLTVYFWVVTAVILFLGTTVFKRLRPHFADVL